VVVAARGKNDKRAQPVRTIRARAQIDVRTRRQNDTECAADALLWLLLRAARTTSVRSLCERFAQERKSIALAPPQRGEGKG
jgi:hypothetical protein